MKKDYQYQYTDVADDSLLYDKELLDSRSSVTARYAGAICSCDRGNPFIEALPHPLTTSVQTIAAYEQPLMDYEGPEERKLPSELRILRLSQLRQLRFALPFHQELETQFYNALCLSYRARTTIYQDQTYACSTAEGELTLHSKLQGNLADAANAGIAILGYSGCGKSSAIRVLLKKYPQVIFHTFGQERIPQIVYLVVSCIPNSNFAALYAGIGRAIDAAFGLSHVYEAEIEKKRTLGDKLSKIIEFTERFSIGMILFDEIQLIDFQGTKENTFESLLVLTNETKVAIAVIGTEDAYQKIFPNLRTARRIGPTISGSSYCANRDFCDHLLKRLFHYQWFDHRLELTQEISDAFYQHTHGIVDQMVGLYMYVQSAYLRTMPRPAVNAKFIENIFNTYYPGVRDILNDITAPSAQSRLQKIISGANARFDLEQLEARQTAQAKEIMDSAEKIKNLHLTKNIIRNIQTVTSAYGADVIAAALSKITGKMGGDSTNETEITKAVFKELAKGDTPSPKPKRAPKRTQKLSHDMMCQELLGE